MVDEPYAHRIARSQSFSRRAIKRPWTQQELVTAAKINVIVRPTLPLRNERGVELFYKFGVTPWFYVTADMQVVTPILGFADTSLVLGARARIDF